ncbi:MAG: HAMP domain-containing histidine kinase [Planctomycetes bacterium]|nr:HAMP domain-containing histidine kinase [Planctomycetota bacterium]
MIALSRDNDARPARDLRRARRRKAGKHGAIGFVAGFAAVHPVAMVIFRWLDSDMGGAAAEHGSGESLFAPVAHSFSMEMIPMGLAFAVLTGAIAAVSGFLRAQLEWQAQELSERNERIEKMEAENRRTAQFLAHDCKAHLGCIIGFSDLLVDGGQCAPGGHETVDTGRRIRRQAGQMLRLVQDLLAVARLHERRKLQRRPVPLRALLEEVAEDFAAAEEGRRIDVGPGAAECPPVLADPELLRRVVWNLVSNALRHNPPDTAVRLDARPCPGEGEIVAWCEDEGQGVAPELRERLFGESETGDESVENCSSGLGLSFCQKAVAAHGGRIWVESAAGGGSRFSFAIPMSKEESNAH